MELLKTVIYCKLGVAFKQHLSITNRSLLLTLRWNRFHRRRWMYSACVLQVTQLVAKVVRNCTSAMIKLHTVESLGSKYVYYMGM